MTSINRVFLVGRLTKDPECRYNASDFKACCRFNLALDRGRDSSGESRGADFPSIVVWGGLAELCERRLSKGNLVAIEGRIHTGDYLKNGVKIYYTEITADNIIFYDVKKDQNVPTGGAEAADLTGDDNWASQVQMDGFAPAEDVVF